MAERQILIALRAGRPRAAIAKELGITKQMLGMVERGDRTPSLGLARRIADYYGVAIDAIFGGKVHEPGPQISAQSEASA